MIELYRTPNETCIYVNDIFSIKEEKVAAQLIIEQCKDIDFDKLLAEEESPRVVFTYVYEDYAAVTIWLAAWDEDDQPKSVDDFVHYMEFLTDFEFDLDEVILEYPNYNWGMLSPAFVKAIADRGFNGNFSAMARAVGRSRQQLYNLADKEQTDYISLTVSRAMLHCLC